MKHVNEKRGTRFHEIGDTCGFYDVFSVRMAIALNPGIHHQRLRDAIRGMVKHGTLERVGNGVYRWTGK